MTKNIFDENDAKTILRDIMGDKELFILSIMYSEFCDKKAGSYKSISSKDPKVNTRDLLNSECALSIGVIENKKLRGKTKKSFGKFEILLLSLLRLNSDEKLEEIECTLNDIQEALRGERIYMEGRRNFLSKALSHISAFLKRKYSMSNKEVSNIVGKSQEQVRKYSKKESEEEGDYLYGEIIEEICQKMDEQHKELLEKQDNKLFIRMGKISKKYLIIDLNKKKYEKGRETIVTEEEANEIIKKIKSNKTETKKENWFPAEEKRKK